MGGGMYSADHRSVRCMATYGDKDYYKTASPTEIFKQKTINNAMSPNGVKLREARDSKEHPNSLAIVLALDCTGSMGSIPVYLVKEGFPHMMESIIQGGVKDPQVLFMGIGDHECDSAPLQIGQFESNDEMLDHWLTTLYLEGGGGGNDGESYSLAWLFAGKNTSIDCWEKRKQKGFLFCVGDEPVLKRIPKHALNEILGPGSQDDADAKVLLDKARETYEVYHIFVKQGSNGQRQDVYDGWKQLMGDHLLVAEDYKEIPKMIADTINKNVKAPTASGAGVKMDEKIIL